MADADIVLRPISESDWPKLVDIEHEVFGDHGYSIYFLRMAPALFGTTSWLAEAAGDACGYALGGRESAEPSIAWLLSMAVRPAYRGRQVGFRLAHRVCDSLAATGASRLRLTVAPDNQVARALYSKLGFEVEASVAAFFGPGQDRLVMGRRL